MRLEKYPGQDFLYFNNTRAFAHEYISVRFRYSLICPEIYAFLQPCIFQQQRTVNHYITKIQTTKKHFATGYITL